MAEMDPPLTIHTSRHFQSWLREAGISLGFTTYQTNRLFLIGSKDDGGLSAFERIFERPMGLYATPERLYMNSLWQIWELDDALPRGETHNGYDRLYVPRRAHTTGHLDVHDIALDGAGRIVFVNTLYSCLATISERYSFKPLWKPPFVSKLVPEDRCHLNGLAMADGVPAYATTVSRSDVVAGWRDRRHTGGCVIDVEDNEVILDSLSMPHSPRVYRDKLWVLNSGTGEFGWVDRSAGRFEPVAFCPGYLRGLAFHGNFAIVGLSKQRKERTFSGLALDDRLRDKDADARCGLWVIDLTTGTVAHWLQLEGVVIELYDVVVIPETRRPMALGFKTDEIQRLITIDAEPRPVFEPLVVPDPASHPPAVSPAPRGGAPARPFAVRGEEKEAAPPSPPEYGQANRLASAGNYAEAIPLYEEVLRRQPGHVNALHNLATVHYRLGNLEAAVSVYRRAIEANPAAVRSLVGLASVLQARGELGEAIRWFEQARRVEPHNPEVLNGLGMALYESGDLSRAKQCFQAALRADPRCAQAHNNLAGILKIEEKRAEALKLHERAVQLDPNFFAAQENIGKIYEEQQMIDAARQAYKKALAIRDDPVLLLHTELLCPPVFACNEALDAYRARAERIIDLFAGRRLEIPLGRVQSSRAEPPYDWAYHGRDNRVLREKYAALFRDAFPQPAELARGPSAGRRRIGFVVTPGHEGVFVRCMGGIVERLDPRRFESTVVCARPGEPVLRSGIRGAHVRWLNFPLRFDHTVSVLREALFDVLYFWEVGTDSTNYFLPFLRLAPVQCTGWGWPETSGAPHLDLHLTSVALCTPDADRLFTEKLLRLPHLPAYFLRPPIPERPGGPEKFGLPAGAHLYVCAQNLRKVLPDFDLLVGAILRADPEGVAVFVADTHPAAGQLLQERWRETLADVAHRVVLLPRLDAYAYFDLIASADVLLDTLGFGGANTAYDAAAAGTPVVTLPTEHPRSRYTSALHRAMGTEELIAGSMDDYVAIALTVGTERALRYKLSERIRAAAPPLFESPLAVRQMEEFLETVRP